MEGIQHLKNLKKLVITKNNISDLSPLRSLTSLEAVMIWGSGNISSLSGLEGLTNLNDLRLPSQRISDLSPLKNLKKLKDLTLYSNQITDLEPLRNLTELRTLELYSNHITNLDPLRNLNKLERLALFRNQINDIEPLANLSNLFYLHLSHNQITDILPILKLTNLKYLYLENNPISNLSPVIDLMSANPHVKIHVDGDGAKLNVKSDVEIIKAGMYEKIVDNYLFNEGTEFYAGSDAIYCYVELNKVVVDETTTVKLYFKDNAYRSLILTFIFKPEDTSYNVVWFKFDKSHYENLPGEWECEVTILDKRESLFFSIREKGSIGVRINDASVTFPVPPILENGRVLVPFRGVGEALGATIQWDPILKKVSFSLKEKSIELIIGKNSAVTEKGEIVLDVPPKIINGATYVPLRFIGESLGATVIWDLNTNTVVINKD